MADKQRIRVEIFHWRELRYFPVSSTNPPLLSDDPRTFTGVSRSAGALSLKIARLDHRAFGRPLAFPSYPISSAESNCRRKLPVARSARDRPATNLRRQRRTSLGRKLINARVADRSISRDRGSPVRRFVRSLVRPSVAGTSMLVTVKIDALCVLPAINFFGVAR